MKFAYAFLLLTVFCPVTTLISGCGSSEQTTVLPAPEISQEELEARAAEEMAPTPRTVDTE